MIHSVEIKHFSVPRFVPHRQDVLLECKFELTFEKEKFYSMKWYRTDQYGKMTEFFSWKPNKPHAKDFKTNGIRVDVSAAKKHCLIINFVFNVFTVYVSCLGHKNSFINLNQLNAIISK